MWAQRHFVWTTTIFVDYFTFYACNFQHGSFFSLFLSLSFTGTFSILFYIYFEQIVRKKICRRLWTIFFKFVWAELILLARFMSRSDKRIRKKTSHKINFSYLPLQYDGYRLKLKWLVCWTNSHKWLIHSVEYSWWVQRHYQPINCDYWAGDVECLSYHRYYFVDLLKCLALVALAVLAAILEPIIDLVLFDFVQMRWEIIC